MEEQLFAGASEADLPALLEDNRDDYIAAHTYAYTLNDEDVLENNNAIKDLSVEIIKLEAKKKAEMKIRNDEIKLLKKEWTRRSKVAEAGVEMVTEPVHVMKNGTTVSYYNDKGVLVESRRAYGKERQTTITSQLREVAK